MKNFPVLFVKYGRKVLKIGIFKKNEKVFYILLIALAAIIFFLFEGEAKQGESPPANLQNAVEEVKEGDEIEQESEEATVFVDIKGAVVHQGVYEVSKSARVKDVISLAGGFTNEADRTMINLAAKVYDEMVIYVPRMGEEGKIPTQSLNNNEEKVNINTATIDEIEELQGIGPTKAAAIVAYREEHGPFERIEDLLNVSGIGEKSLEKIKGQILIQ